MDPMKELEEKLREAASIGDEDTVRSLVGQGVNINSQNAMNGWSALHWAAKRGFVGITSMLLDQGADKNLQTSRGETPLAVTSDPKVTSLLGGVYEGQATMQNGNVKTLPIVPNYLASPPFPYLSQTGQKQHIEVPINLKVTPSEERDEDVSDIPKPRESLGADLSLNKSSSSSPVTSSPQPPGMELRLATTHPQGVRQGELVIKIRVANAAETDFIEVELDRSNLTFDALLEVMCRELQVERRLVQKVRKLPNTKMRNDKDVKRLTDFQELELVLNARTVTESTPNSQGLFPRNVDVVLY